MGTAGTTTARKAGDGRNAPRRVRRPLGRKLAILFAVSVAVAVVLNTIASLWQVADDFAASRRETLTATAQVLAAGASDAVARRSAADAVQSLRAIARIPGVDYTGVEAADGTVLAELGSAVRLDSDTIIRDASGPQSLLGMVRSRTIAVVVPVVHGGERVGRLVIVSDASALWTALLRQIGWAAASGALALALGLLVVMRLRRSIVEPVTGLIAATRDIATTHDYRRTIPDGGDDELGLLVEDFNTMLREIRTRDAHLAQHRANLEQEVEDRTADYRTARDAAEAANAAKTVFLATMSHEIRTPLNGMLVMADLLTRSPLPPVQQRYAAVVASSGKSLVAIIDDVLDLSKVEAGRMTLEAIAVDPAEIVDRILMLFAEKAAGKGLDLSASVDALVPASISADPVRFGQIVSNLVGNALKFTEKGTVTVAIRRSTAKPAELRVDVTDSGIGIPAGKLADVFEPYTQAESSTTRRFGGTGLGLTICRRIAEAMGGRIDVSSEEGIGTCFSVVLPVDAEEPGRRSRPSAGRRTRGTVALAVAGPATRNALVDRFLEVGYRVVEPGTEPVSILVVDRDRLDREHALRVLEAERVATLSAMGAAAPDKAGRPVDAHLRLPLLMTDLDRLIDAAEGDLAWEKLTATETAPAVDMPAWPGRRVLVVDDNGVNREVAVEALSRFGCEVAAADGGPEAINLVESDTYDLIFMDVSMPGMDGYEATRHIRGVERAAGRAPVPIVALTAFADDTAWRHADMQGRLPKPFTIEDIGQCLSAHLGRREPARSAPDGGIVPAVLPEDVPLAADSPATGILDPAIAARWTEYLASGRREFVDRVIGLYCRLAPACVADLRQAMAGADTRLVHERAHALRSMSANIGASRVAADAQAIESAAARGEGSPADAIEALGDAVTAAIAALVRLGTPAAPGGPGKVGEAA